MPNDLEDLRYPTWQNAIDLPSFLQNVVDQMRRGDWEQSCEALVLTMSSEGQIVTILRWGEPSGLCSEMNLLDVAKASRTNA